MMDDALGRSFAFVWTHSWLSSMLGSMGTLVAVDDCAEIRISLILYPAVLFA